MRSSKYSFIFRTGRKRICIITVKVFWIRLQQKQDLLFDDDNIIENIKEHPMAVWRTNRFFD